MQARWQDLDAIEVVFQDDMDGPNAPIITAIVTIDADITAAWLCDNVGKRLAEHPRFRSVIDKTTGKFALVTHFDVHNHVTQHDEELNDAVLEGILSTALLHGVPYWHLHVFSSGSRASKILFRFHHVICDGMSIARFFQEHIVDKEDGTTHNPKDDLAPRSEMFPSLAAVGAKPTMLDDLTRVFRDLFASIVRLLIPDPSTFLTSAPLTPAKHAVWTRRRSVSQLRESTRALGLTINEVLLGALCGALRTHFSAIGESVPRGGLTCAVPVNLHPPSNVSLWNAATLLLLKLPVGDGVRESRVAKCVRDIRDMLAGRRPPLMRTLVYVLAWLPRKIRMMLWRHITRAPSIGLTNVIGPPNLVHIGGHQVSQVQVLAAGLGACSVVCTAFSTGGFLQLGIVANPARLPQPQRFAQAFDAELDAIREWTRAS